MKWLSIIILFGVCVFFIAGSIANTGTSLLDQVKSEYGNPTSSIVTYTNYWISPCNKVCNKTQMTNIIENRKKDLGISDYEIVESSSAVSRDQTKTLIVYIKK